MAYPGPARLHVPGQSMALVPAHPRYIRQVAIGILRECRPLHQRKENQTYYIIEYKLTALSDLVEVVVYKSFLHYGHIYGIL